MDQFVIKLRLVRHLRTPEYNELFGGDPTWVTEALEEWGWTAGRLVTKNSFRMLHTLTNLGTAPEPNLTVLWSPEPAPEAFKDYCARMSIDTDSIQYENDDLMRPMYGDDYCIACCVSAMAVGKQMQFFGARANLAKSLLYAINGGVDELKGLQVIPRTGKEYRRGPGLLPCAGGTIRRPWPMWRSFMWTPSTSSTSCMINMPMRASQMALHDTLVERLAAFGVAGLSVAADSLSRHQIRQSACP